MLYTAPDAETLPKWKVFIVRSLFENNVGDCSKKWRLTSQSVLPVLFAFLSLDHAKLSCSVSLQQYFSAHIFMCLNMDHETDTPNLL